MTSTRVTLAAIAATTLLLTTACSSTESPDEATESAAVEGNTDSEAAADGDDTVADGSNPGGEATGTSGALTANAVAAAEALLAVLSDEQLATLLYDFGDQTIASSWSNLPACEAAGRAGIRHGDLSEEPLDAVLAVADAVLSEEGFSEYRQIIAADEDLGGGNGDVWDADCYYLAFFGTPSTTEAWALQFGGHHYARTVAFADGATAITPAFTGVEPKSFTLDGATIEPLADEAAAIFAIFDALDDSQLATAEIGGAFDDVLLGPGDDDAFPESEGIALADLSGDVRDLVLNAIRTWVDDFDADAADSLMTEIESELDDTYVGWSSSTDADAQGSYARIDGPSVWIEFINQSGVGTGDIHHHSIYRDKTNDYGTAA